MRERKSSYGFTLVEIAVVILIIGLLLTGITAARCLAKKSELNSVISDIVKFNVAISDFQEKYMDLPGDMTDAQSYWPESFNGNGNGKLSWNTEGLRMWQHLSLAGFINGSYTSSSRRDVAKKGINVPAAKLEPGEFSVYYRNPWGQGFYNYIYLGISNGSFPWNAIVSPSEAWSIDKKLDDGFVNRGSVMAASGSSLPAELPRCNIAADSTEYNLTVSENVCYMIFRFPS